jgi:hypothetical protein
LKALGFHHVTLDLEGFRSGSMNASLLTIGRTNTLQALNGQALNGQALNGQALTGPALNGEA